MHSTFTGISASSAFRPLLSCFVRLALHLLRVFYSVTDCNAMLQTGSMFVLSRSHAQQLLQPALTPTTQTGARSPPSLLDVGAGDGHVTQCLGHLFSSVTVTEVSARMCRRLQSKGFSRVICCDSIGPSDDLFAKGEVYDVVSLMNIVDRCHDPAQVQRMT